MPLLQRVLLQALPLLVAVPSVISWVGVGGVQSEIGSRNQVKRIISIADPPAPDPETRKDYLAELKRNSDVIHISGSGGEHFLIVAQAGRDDGRIIGMLTARIPLASLNHIINAIHNGLSTVETLWLVNTGTKSPRLLSTRLAQFYR